MTNCCRYTLIALSLPIFFPASGCHARSKYDELKSFYEHKYLGKNVEFRGTVHTVMPLMESDPRLPLHLPPGWPPNKKASFVGISVIESETPSPAEFLVTAWFDKELDLQEGQLIRVRGKVVEVDVTFKSDGDLFYVGVDLDECVLPRD